MDQLEIANGMREERERLVSYLEGLAEAAWEKPSLCEGWSIRDLVSHLVGNATDVVARNLEGAGSAEYNQRQVDERAGRSPAELLAEWAEQGPLLEQGIAELAQDFWEAPYPPIGTVGDAVQRLLEDLWVHAQDIRVPLGDEVTTGPGLTATLDVLAHELPERAGRLAPGIGSVDLRAGEFARTVPVNEGGAAIAVSGDPVALALAATGRIALDGAIGDGKLAVSPAPPSGFADALNIYGP